MGANIGDVARRAGVGRSTVSRVLNGRPNVDPDTRRRVERAIADLDYHPSPTARSLASGRSRTVAVVVPFLTRPSGVERLRGIEATLAEQDYDMVVFNVETTDRREHVMRELVRLGRVDGLILVHLSPSEDEARRLTREGMPTVLLDAHHRAFPRVVSDDVAGGRLATRHLVALGHQRIGFVGDELRSPFRFSSSRLRLRGVRDVLRESDIDLPDAIVATGGHSRRDGDGSARDGCSSRRLPPTAIVCASDTQAIGVLEASRRLGLPVPGALSVVGYDDIEIAELVGLTTIRQPLLESGHRAADVLDTLGGVPGRLRRRSMDLQLAFGATTSTPAGSRHRMAIRQPRRTGMPGTVVVPVPRSRQPWPQRRRPVKPRFKAAGLAAAFAVLRDGAPAAPRRPHRRPRRPRRPPASRLRAVSAAPSTGGGSTLDRALAGEFKGTTVTALGPFADAEDQVKFEATVSAFESATGIDVSVPRHQGIRGDRSAPASTAGNAPDVGGLPAARAARQLRAKAGQGRRP